MVFLTTAESQLGQRLLETLVEQKEKSAFHLRSHEG